MKPWVWMLVLVLMSGMLAAALPQCEAESNCAGASVEASVEGVGEELTLADLLSSGSCAQLREAAARVRLGATPRAGSVRIFDGGQIRQLLNQVVDGDLSSNIVGARIPGRIAVRRRGAKKSCAEMAKFVAGAAASHGMAEAAGPVAQQIQIKTWQERMDCAAIPSLAEDAPLELTRTAWNVSLRRWEFALRCVRPEDCVPFLLWFREAGKPQDRPAEAPGGLAARASEADAKTGHGGDGAERLVKRGQTATLAWDQAGIRVVLPVTCLDGGGRGQFVRVRFKNAPRIVRAEVLSDGTLRASL